MKKLFEYIWVSLLTFMIFLNVLLLMLVCSSGITFLRLLCLGPLMLAGAQAIYTIGLCIATKGFKALR